MQDVGGLGRHQVRRAEWLFAEKGLCPSAGRTSIH
jgi:hypothetical protein